MGKRLNLLLVAGVVMWSTTVLSQQVFRDLSSVLRYADTASTRLKSGSIREEQARKARLAALISVADPQANNSASFTNNTTLPVSILPADAFGGEPGASREIRIGTRYNTAVVQSVELKLLNPEGWANLRLSKVNLEMAQTDSRLTKKELYENIAGAYFNIVQLQEQAASLRRNSAVSDSLLVIVRNKYAAGQVKQQDVNDAEVNVLTLRENARQLDFLCEQQRLALAVLIDLPADATLTVEQEMPALPSLKPEIGQNLLSADAGRLKEDYARLDYRRRKWSMLPTLSFVANQGFNLYNEQFSVTDGNWISSNYVGLKLSVPLPTSRSIADRFNARYDHELAQQSARQAALEAEQDNRNLSIEWDKAVSQWESKTAIQALQADTYQKNRRLYTEGLIGLDRTLESLNTLIQTDYDLVESKVDLMLAMAKIEINNQIR